MRGIVLAAKFGVLGSLVAGAMSLTAPIANSQVAGPLKEYRTLLQVELSKDLRWTKEPTESRRKHGVSLSGPDPSNPTFVGLTNVDDTWGPIIAPPRLEI